MIEQIKKRLSELLEQEKLLNGKIQLSQNEIQIAVAQKNGVVQGIYELNKLLTEAEKITLTEVE